MVILQLLGVGYLGGPGPFCFFFSVFSLLLSFCSRRSGTLACVRGGCRPCPVALSDPIALLLPGWLNNLMGPQSFPRAAVSVKVAVASSKSSLPQRASLPSSQAASNRTLSSSVSPWLSSGSCYGGSGPRWMRSSNRLARSTGHSTRGCCRWRSSRGCSTCCSWAAYGPACFGGPAVPPGERTQSGCGS